jgi:hypothetical protein
LANCYAQSLEFSPIDAEPGGQTFGLFAAGCFPRSKDASQWLLCLLEVQDGRLTFPERQEQPAAIAQRYDPVVSYVGDLKPNFVLVSNKHYRIALWSNFEHQVPFIVSRHLLPRPVW